jgi:hypothetical protein
MRINTAPFKKYLNVLTEFYSKGGGNEKTEGIFFNFDTGYAYVQNSISDIYGRIKFEFEKEDGDNIKNFIINIRKFLNIAQTSDYILLDNDYVFYTEGSNFKLKLLFEDMPEVLELFDKPIDYNEMVIFDKSKLDELKKANKYLYKKLDFPYRAIYIQNNYISAVLSDQVYEAKFECPVTEPISIYNDFCVFLNLLEENTTLYINSQFNKIENDSKDISLIMPKIELPLSEVHKDSFIEQYDVPNVIEFKIDELALGLAVLSPYYKNSKDRKVSLIVSDSNNVSMKFENEGEIINTNVDAVNIEDITDLRIDFDGDILKKALEVLEGTIVRIAINDNKNLAYLKSNIDDERKVILCLYDKQ